MSFLLTLPGMVATGFVAGLILGMAFANQWKTVGCALTALAAAFAAVRLVTAPGSQLFDIFFAALWAAIGAFPGAAVGSWIYSRLRRSP